MLSVNVLKPPQTDTEVCVFVCVCPLLCPLKYPWSSVKYIFAESLLLCTSALVCRRLGGRDNRIRLGLQP